MGCTFLFYGGASKHAIVACRWQHGRPGAVSVEPDSPWDKPGHDMSQLALVPRSCRSEAIEPEARDVVAGGSGGDEIGNDFSDHRRELEAVTGARRRND